jgi:hypothetical protein
MIEDMTLAGLASRTPGRGASPLPGIGKSNVNWNGGRGVVIRCPSYLPSPSTPCGDRSGLRPPKRPVGLEEAPTEGLASVRRSNWSCSFPASGRRISTVKLLGGGQFLQAPPNRAGSDPRGARHRRDTATLRRLGFRRRKDAPGSLIQVVGARPERPALPQ